MVEIRIISNVDTYLIRKKALYPDKDIELVKTDDDERGIHYGLYKDNILISVITAVITEDYIKLRKFATTPNYQNKGYGKKLFSHVLNIYKDKDIILDARLNSLYFYLKYNFTKTDKSFKRNEIEYVEMIRRI